MIFKYMGYNSDEDLSGSSSQRGIGLTVFLFPTVNFLNKNDFLNTNYNNILNLSFSLLLKKIKG